MSNSPLVVYTKLSPNHSGKRTKKRKEAVGTVVTLQQVGRYGNGASIGHRQNAFSGRPQGNQ